VGDSLRRSNGLRPVGAARFSAPPRHAGGIRREQGQVDELRAPGGMIGPRKAGDLAFGLSVAVLLAVSVLAAWPALVTTQSPARQSLLDRHRPPGHVDAAGRSHPLGTDHLGRDVWSRLAHGARASLTVGYARLALPAAL